MRAASEPGRPLKWARMSDAAVLMRRSPSAWPSRSFTFFRSLRSKATTVMHVMSGLPSLAKAVAAASSRALRLASAVIGSW